MKFWEAIKFRGKYIVIGMFALLAIVAVAIIIKLQYDANARQDAMNKSLVEMKQLTDGIVRSQSKYVDKEDLEAFGKDINLDAIRDDLEELDAKIVGISIFLAQSTGYHGTNLPSSNQDPKDDPDDPTQPTPENICEDPMSSWCLMPHSVTYMENAQIQELKEPFANGEVPIGDVTFKAWKKNPWDVNIHPRNYKVSSVLGQDRDGRHYLHHKFEIESQGETHEVQINDAEFVEQYPESQWEWWNPKVAIGVAAGVAIPTDGSHVTGSVTPGLYFSPFSYGKTKIKPDWIFAQIGVGYDVINETAQFSLSPAMYNLGAESTIIHNTFVGPTISVDTDENVTLGGTVAVTF